MSAKLTSANLEPSECWQDLAGDLLSVADLCRRPLARQVFGDETLAQVGDGWRRPTGFEFAEWVATAVNAPLELNRLGPRRRGLPGRKGADRVAVLTPKARPIGQHEGARAARCYADAEAFQVSVVGDGRTALRNRQRLDQLVGDVGDHGSCTRCVLRKIGNFSACNVRLCAGYVKNCAALQ